MFTNPACGEITVFAPQGGGTARVYLCFWKEMKPKFHGSADVARLLADLKWTGLAQEYFRQAKQVGPLATFEGPTGTEGLLQQSGVQRDGVLMLAKPFPLRDLLRIVDHLTQPLAA